MLLEPSDNSAKFFKKQVQANIKKDGLNRSPARKSLGKQLVNHSRTRVRGVVISRYNHRNRKWLGNIVVAVCLFVVLHELLYIVWRRVLQPHFVLPTVLFHNIFAWKRRATVFIAKSCV